jgi:hypothetical protein
MCSIASSSNFAKKRLLHIRNTARVKCFPASSFVVEGTGQLFPATTWFRSRGNRRLDFLKPSVAPVRRAAYAGADEAGRRCRADLGLSALPGFLGERQSEAGFGRNLDEACWRRAAFENKLDPTRCLVDEETRSRFLERYAELRNGWRVAMSDLSAFPAGISAPDLWQVEFEECGAEAPAPSRSR